MTEKIEWDGVEYINQKHNIWWFVILFVIAVALGALAVWWKLWMFLAVIILIAIVILIRNFKKPAKIHYVLTDTGLKEGGQFYRFADMKAFGLLKDGEQYSAVLIPKKRLGMQVKVYFPDAKGEKIVDMLGMHLPMQEIKLDILDKIVKFLRI